MLEIGENDEFEREYTAKFRALAAKYGEFVFYERDRGARDIGLHLTKEGPSGKRRMTASLCWFQLKGFKASTLSASEIKKANEVTIRLKVRHLKFWYLQPITTHLVVYLEATNQFLVADIQLLIHELIGPHVLRSSRKTIAVKVPTDSTLDEQAFRLILMRGDTKEWQKALESDNDTAWQCCRDYHIIWRLGTAKRRKATHRVDIVDWQSKLRGEIHFRELNPKSDKYKTFREHLQLGLRAGGVESMYPYCEFYRIEDEEDERELIADELGEEDETYIPLTLSNGEVVYGENAMGEAYLYHVGVRLNKLGKRLFKSVKQLAEIGLIEVSEDTVDYVSFAPWHHRSV